MNKTIISSELFTRINARTFRLNFAIDTENETESQIHNFELIQKGGDRLQFDAYIDMINWNEDYTIITISGVLTEMRKNKSRVKPKVKDELIFGLTHDEFIKNSSVFAEKMLEAFKLIKKDI